jgi:hypothetical protein
MYQQTGNAPRVHSVSSLGLSFRLANWEVVCIQLPVLLLHALPHIRREAVLHRERDELRRVAQVRQLKRDKLAIHCVEERIVTAEAVEIRVDASGLQQFRKVLVELSHVLVVFSVCVKEYTCVCPKVMLYKIWKLRLLLQQLHPSLTIATSY